MAEREENLAPPRRQAVDWQSTDYYEKTLLETELERVFDICHGCRRCVSLCNAFPTLFDLVDKSNTMEIDGVSKEDYYKVVDECYLCDLCAETKCPYLPPHSWAVDFPHLMLRAKAHQHQNKQTRLRDRIIASTDQVLPLVSTPGVSGLANAAGRSILLRKLGDSLFGIHAEAPLPKFANKTAKKLLENWSTPNSQQKVAIYVSCYGDACTPEIVSALANILRHNDVEVDLIHDTACCGVPKLEIGDLPGVKKLMEKNLDTFATKVQKGFKIMSVVPSCTWMYRRELPLLFPENETIQRISEAMVAPFEYFAWLHKNELLKTDFPNSLGRVTYHASCHQRTQNVGLKTKEILSLVPGTEVIQIERCSGHDGTYALRSESYLAAKKISRPVVRKVRDSKPDTWGSDCPMASNLIESELDTDIRKEHPIEMMARAYGLTS